MNRMTHSTSCTLALAAALAGLMTAQGIAQPDPCTVSPSQNWKNTIDFVNEPFRVVGDSASNPDWVKFTILLCDPDTVYFQDSNEYPLHYGFATNELDPFLGISVEDFNDVTLYAAGQEAVLGAVLMPASGIYPPPPEISEFAIQLVRQDAYDPDDVIQYFHLVEGAVNAGPEVEAFYFPTYEQQESAQQNAAYLADHGVIIGSPARWLDGNAVYSEGWALGELKYFDGNDIDNAYEDGDLLPTDILLTDAVPAEIPFVAGILTLNPSTPNSHVAILANSYNVPFVFLADEDDAAYAQSLVGRQMAVTAYEDWTGTETRLLDIQDQLTAQQVAEILELKELPPLDIQPMATYGGYSASTDNLTLADVQYFGGKASNYGFLRRAIPDNSRKAGALSFDLWNEYLDQELPGGQTLREAIQEKLGGYTWPVADINQLSDDLDDVQDLIDDVADFTPQQRAAIIAFLQDPQYEFDPLKKIRFRSSTNVEDSEQFTGAGLYESKSGCLADDLDGDDEGPSICDPDRNNERGVFRAIRKVYKSFYRDNAFLERLRWGVNEADVGMAVLVHHSFPDDLELANGVSTLDHTGYSTQIHMVSQLGATSVSNPDDGSTPEEVDVYVYNSFTYAYIRQYSNLVPIGHTVMDFDGDYISFGNLMDVVAEDYAAYIGETDFLLDFEYKKIDPDGQLIVKQVRKIPQPDTTPSITPFLINDPVNYCVYQGEQTEVFANHRLKSKWELASRNMWLNSEELAAGLFTDASVEYTDQCAVRDFAGELAEFPHASHHYDPETHVLENSWVFDDLPNPTTYTLQVLDAGLLVAPSENPLLLLSDLGQHVDFFPGHQFVLQARYDKEVPVYDWQGPATTTEEQVLIAPCWPEANPDDIPQHLEFEVDGVVFTVDFFWPPDPGAAAGYTAPATRWVQTVIEGLTTEPIVLTSWYAQTYKPEHHNFGEHFIFEPRLEPGISPAILAELDAQRIKYIHAQLGFGDPTITYYDGHKCVDIACEDNSDCGYPDYRYCAKATGECDSVGVCKDVPDGCFALWDPVCGCDGQTYSNGCYAALAGVSVDYQGECVQICGGIAGLPCDEGEFCKFPDGTCDVVDQFGVCTEIPGGCFLPVIDPVCGCDGVTYAYECFADMAGVSIDYDGPCEKEGACCLPDGDCIITRPSLCDEQCGKYRGNGTKCITWGALEPLDAREAVTDEQNAPVASIGEGSITPIPVRRPCRPFPRAACCLPDDTCFDTYKCDCDRQGGAWQGIGNTCETTDCSPPTGRCCVEGACTDDVTEEECLAECGLWSDQFTCAEVSCGLLVGGACCLDGSCMAPVSQHYCECQGGTYRGDFTECVNGDECPETCGGIAGLTCDKGQFCLLPEGHCCCDFAGVCQPIPGGCPLPVIDPVCGCNGVTYSYDCFAYRAGTSIDHRGPCASDSMDQD